MGNSGIEKWIRENKIVNLPRRKNDKINLFCYITNLEFENGVEYTEKEINHKLVNYYEDYALLRRYLVDFGLLERSKDCSVYIRKQDREYVANNNH